MPGTAGIAACGKRALVKRMLNKMAHRGHAGKDLSGRVSMPATSEEALAAATDAALSLGD